MKPLDYFLVDVFTDQIFGGNPLAIFPNADELSGSLMQKIARELNLSETTFIQQSKTEGCDCTVRIFTPAREIPMAGHPTIGTAYTILKHSLMSPLNESRLVFDLGVGPTVVDFRLSKEGPTALAMHQQLPQFLEILDRGMTAEALSLELEDLDPDLPVQIVSCGYPFILVPLKGLDALRRANLKVDLLDRSFPEVEPREVMVFTRETEHPDSTVHGRVFGPRLGIIEDPATGSAHGPLGCYLVRHGLSDGKGIMGEQGFEMGRASLLQVEIRSERGEICDVLVGGSCMEVGTGRLFIHR